MTKKCHFSIIPMQCLKCLKPLVFKVVMFDQACCCWCWSVTSCFTLWQRIYWCKLGDKIDHNSSFCCSYLRKNTSVARTGSSSKTGACFMQCSLSAAPTLWVHVPWNIEIILLPQQSLQKQVYFCKILVCTTMEGQIQRMLCALFM